MGYSFGRFSASKVTRISMGKISLVALSRAPHVTEDVAYEA